MTVTIPENEEAEEAEAEGGDREAGGRRERRPALRPEEVGVIVPYRAQAMQIMKMMKASGSVDGWMVGLVGFVWVAGESPPFAHTNQSINPSPTPHIAGERFGDAGPLGLRQGGHGGLLPGRGAGGDRLQLRAHRGPRLPRLPAPVRALSCVRLCRPLTTRSIDES